MKRKVKSNHQGVDCLSGPTGASWDCYATQRGDESEKESIAWPIWDHHSLQILDLLSEMREDRPGDSSHPFSMSIS